MRIIKYIIVCIAISFIWYSCKKDETPQDSFFPLVRTLEVSDISANGATLNGEILSKGLDDITEYGFIMKSETDSTSIILKLSDISEKVSHNIEYGLKKDKNYSIIFYTKSNRFMSLGNSVSFISLGSKTINPKIYNFSPKSCYDNSLVTIEGVGFGFNKDDIKVYIGDKISEIISVTDNILIIKVPVVSSEGDYNLKIVKDSKEIISKDKLTISDPIIGSFSPDSIFDEKLITIKGKGFGDKYNTIVKINDNYCSIETINDSIITASPYYYNLHGDMNIMVSVNNKEVIAPNKIHIKYPVVKNVFPLNAKLYDTITITGKNFIINNDTSEVYYKKTVFQSKNKLKYIYNGSTEAIKIKYYKRYYNKTISTNYSISKQDVWHKISPFPFKGNSAGSFSINNKGYIVCGNYSYNSKYLYEYSPDTDKWNKKSDFPGKTRINPITMVYDNKAYVGLGGFYDMWEYSPNNDTWRRLSDFPDNPYNNYTFTINNKIYVGIVNSNKTYQYDVLEDKWIKSFDMPNVIMSKPVIVNHNNFTYIICQPQNSCSQVLIFNNESNEPSTIELKVDKYISNFYSSYNINNYIFIESNNNIIKWNPEQNTIRYYERPPLGSYLNNWVSFSTNKSIFIGLGSNDRYSLNRFYKFKLN